MQYWQYNIHYCTGRQVGKTSRQIQLRVVQLPILYYLCWGHEGKEGIRTRDCHSAAHGVDRSTNRPAV